MLFIVSNLFLLGVVLSLIVHKVIQECLISAFLESRHAKTFRKRISSAISELFWETCYDCFAHLTTLCELDGDEPFEPYMDSPLRTCPPCEYVKISPTELQTDANGNDNNNNGRVLPRQTARRGRIQALRMHARGRGHDVVRPAVPVLPLVIIQNGEQVERIPPIMSPPPIPDEPHVAVARRMIDVLEAEAMRHREVMDNLDGEFRQLLVRRAQRGLPQ